MSIFETVTAKNLDPKLRGLQASIEHLCSTFSLDPHEFRKQFFSTWPMARCEYAGGMATATESWATVLLRLYDGSHGPPHPNALLTYVLCRKVCWSPSSSAAREQLLLNMDRSESTETRSRSKMKESTESNMFILVTAEIPTRKVLYEIADGAQGQGGGRGGEGGGGGGMGGGGHKGTGKRGWEEGDSCRSPQGLEKHISEEAAERLRHHQASIKTQGTWTRSSTGFPERQSVPTKS